MGLEQKRGELVAQNSQYHADMRVLVPLINQLPLALAAPFFGLIQQMQSDPFARVRSSSLLASVYGMVMQVILISLRSLQTGSCRHSVAKTVGYLQVLRIYK